jgi:hypothetical protein
MGGHAMTMATKLKDKPHARIYADWLRLSAWRNISPHARALLVEMLTGYRLGTNGTLEWPQSRVAKLLGCGNVKAAETLVELEKAGWIEVTRAGAFAGARPSTLYRLTKYDCSLTGDPASHAYLTVFVPPRQVLKRNPTGANQKLAGFYQSSQQVLDNSGEAPDNAPVPITDALRKSLMRKGLIPRTRVKSG